jgi:catechol 2,3-dioxygenase-like lactoylglutathione lyase family enzyme
VFSHVVVGVTDFDRAYRFYAPILLALGLPQRFYDPAKPWAGWNNEAGARPLFVIGHPFDGHTHQAGNGQMIAFDAPNRGLVDDIYSLAITHGGTCEGPPGLRPQYHANYYGAYFRDPDGNKLCIVCHSAA